MAVTDTTLLTELVNSEFINDAVLMYAHDETVSASFINWLDLRGKATKVGSFPKWVLDTATDITNETTTLNNESLETTDVQVTAAEIGVRRDVADAAVEETVLGAQLFDFIVVDGGTLCGISLEDDICALYPSFSTSVGATGVNLTLANMVEAQAQVRTNGQRGQLINILHTQQASDYQAAQAAATSTTVNDFFSVGTGIETGYLGTFMGAQVWTTGLCDDANTTADVVGACFVRGDTNPKTAAIGGVITRDIRVATDRDEPNRLTQVVITAKWGVAEISDLSGTAIITDNVAP
jgi:hypothetical protein